MPGSLYDAFRLGVLISRLYELNPEDLKVLMRYGTVPTDAIANTLDGLEAKYTYLLTEEERSIFREIIELLNQVNEHLLRGETPPSELVAQVERKIRELLTKIDTKLPQ